MKTKLKKLFGYLLGASILVGGAYGLISMYVSGTVSGTVQQAITVTGCDVPVGTCTVSDDNLSFAWNMGSVYQGDEYTGTVVLHNDANHDIKVKVLVAEVSATGGNNQFEGEIIVPDEPITVPAGGSAEFNVTVKINPAEEPGEQYTATIQVVPYTE